ncbi:MAG: ATP-binding protein [Patescibacteria group bacterium]|jgi:hypothetical protein
MYKRLLKEQIQEKLFKGKAVIITGARQTGKTTLAGEILSEANKKVKIFNCDNPTDRELLNNKDLEYLELLIGDAEIILIDEGQKVETIGQTLKLLADYFKDKKQIIATGSSSINLLDKTQEALTGRKFVYHLFTLSLEEIYPSKDYLKISKEIENYLIYGNYPDVVTKSSFDEKKELLKELSSSSLYRDILEFQEIKNSTIILNLLKALALQIGHEVSYTEISSLVGIDKNTVERYVDLLEKSYIIFRLPPYAKNKRREISKLRKIYFYDLGIRNAIINNFNALGERNDKGVLWENFLVAERLKYQAYHKIYANNYFWRTYDGAEVDLVEEREGRLYGFEFKWNKKKKTSRPSLKWLEYQDSSYQIICPDDMRGFII